MYSHEHYHHLQTVGTSCGWFLLRLDALRTAAVRTVCHELLNGETGRSGICVPITVWSRRIRGAKSKAIINALIKTYGIACMADILWICTDQQRWDTIGALGNNFIHTPNIDRLVNEGVAFDHAFCTSPICTPSRAGFLTGMYPCAIKACKNGAESWAEQAPLVTKLFKDMSYVCGLSGKLHLSSAMKNDRETRPRDDGYSVFHYSHSPHQGGKKNDYLVWLEKRGYSYKGLLSWMAGHTHTFTRQHGVPTAPSISYARIKRSPGFSVSISMILTHL